MKYTGIIFDLDGVICSTDQYHYQAWNQLAKELSIPFSPEINNSLRGVGRMESLDIILNEHKTRYTLEEKQTFAQRKNDYYRELLHQMSPADLADDVKDTLMELRARGLLLAIGSSSKNTPFILEKLGLANFFDAISDGNNLSHPKPDPEVFLKAAEMISLPAEACLVVEDASAGVRAAQNGHFDCAALGNACNDVTPTYRLQIFSDLLRVL